MSALLEVRNLVKSFPGVVALKGVSFQVDEGEVHALVGQNGAGKTTLVNIICGVIKPDSGDLIWKGEKILLQSPAHAQRLGIAYVTQEGSLFEKLTIKQNIIVGSEPVCFGFLINWQKASQIAQNVLNVLETGIDINRLVGELSFGERQLVEIARALYRANRLLILDEPTSGLTRDETEKLFRVIKKLRDTGCSVIYITHKLDEVFSLADKVTVLRDGNVVATKNVNELTPEELIRMMTGRDIAQHISESTMFVEPIIEIKALTTPYLKNIHLTIYKGEILGLAGLPDSGVEEFMESIAGVRGVQRGEISIGRRAVKIRSPAEGIKHGVFYAPKDRRRDGLFLPLTLLENITSSSLKQHSRFGILKKRDECAIANNMIELLRINPPRLHRRILFFSGGNQQKAIVARALTSGAKVLILNDPTRGIDIGAKNEIYDFLRTLAAQNITIILTSSELDELLLLSHRIITFYRGEISGEFVRPFSKEQILQSIFGEK